MAQLSELSEIVVIAEALLQFTTPVKISAFSSFVDVLPYFQKRQIKRVGLMTDSIQFKTETPVFTSQT